MEEINIQTEDGRLLAGNWIRATGALPVRGTVVIHSATGVPCKFYNAFAAYLSEQAFDVFLWDARGIGKSATVHARDDAATMRDWGQRDQQAVLQHLISSNSSGGQVEDHRRDRNTTRVTTARCADTHRGHRGRS